jgi:hypothetical protein
MPNLQQTAPKHPNLSACEDVMDAGPRFSWQQFSRLWPSRDDAFSTKMNTVPKLVASRTLTRVDEWQNSQLLQGDLVAEVQPGAAALLTYQRARAA